MGIRVCRICPKRSMALYLKITHHEVYKPCAECHAVIKKCTIICYAALLYMLLVCAQPKMSQNGELSKFLW